MSNSLSHIIVFLFVVVDQKICT